MIFQIPVLFQSKEVAWLCYLYFIIKILCFCLLVESVSAVLLDFEDLLGWSSELLDERIVRHSVVYSLWFCFLASLSSEIVLLLLNGFMADEEHGLLCQLIEFELRNEALLVFALRDRHQLGSLHRLTLAL